MINEAICVIADKQSAIGGKGNADRSPCGGAIAFEPAGDKIFGRPGNFSISQRNAHYFITCSRSTIPGAVERNVGIRVSGWSELDINGGGMSLENQNRFDGILC